MAAARLRALWPPPRPAQAGELAGQGQRLGEQGGAVGGLEGACFPGDLRRQLRLAAEGGPDGDAEAVARVAARVASGRGGVGHGDGDLAAAAEPADGFGHGEVVAVVVDVADHDRGAVHDAVPPDGGWRASWAGAGQGAGGAAGCRECQLGFGEQGAEDLPVVLAEGDGPVEVGGHALELAEVVEAQAVVEALLDLAELRADHGGVLADGLLGGVDSPGGVLDGVGGGPVAAVDELAELAVGDAVVVHGLLLWSSRLPFHSGCREGQLRPSRGAGLGADGGGGGGGVFLEVHVDRLPAVIGQLLGYGDER